jgi:hypothetical protein
MWRSVARLPGDADLPAIKHFIQAKMDNIQQIILVSILTGSF